MNDKTARDEFGELDPSRRTFIKRLAAGAAVGAAVSPVVTSFSMSGLTGTPAFAVQAPNTSIPSNLP